MAANDEAKSAALLKEFRDKAEKDDFYSVSDLWMTRFLEDQENDVEKALHAHKEAVLWRKQFQVDKINIGSVHDELHTGKVIFPDCVDKDGRQTMILRPRFVVKATVVPLEFMKSCVYLMEKAIKKMKDHKTQQMVLVVDFSNAVMDHVDTRLPRILLQTIQANYPRFVGKIRVVSPPWFFKYVWVVISRWMNPYIKNMVKIVGPADLKDDFTEDNIIEELGGKKAHDFRDWIRAQFAEEGVDPDKMKKNLKGIEKKDSDKTEEDALIVQAMADEAVSKVVMEGHMTKLGGIVKNWKKRYCVLGGGLLRYYTDEKQPKPQGVVVLERSRVAPAEEYKDKKFAFLIVTPLRTWVFVAESEQAQKDWMKNIEEQCQWATEISNKGAGSFQ